MLGKRFESVIQFTLFTAEYSVELFSSIATINVMRINVMHKYRG